MENSIQTSARALRPSGRTGPMRATLALGAAILLGFVAYSAIIVITQPASFNGARVNGLNIDSRAWDAGVIPDDVITHINGTELGSLAHLRQMFTDSSDRKMTWTVERHGGTITIDVLPDTENASNQTTVGVFLSGTYKGRKDLILDALPAVYVGAGFLVLGALIGLRLKRTNRRNNVAAT